MEKQERIYATIDLKSFYASVECVERQLDPLTTNLVVADAARSSKTICLAVSPSLKAYGIAGRARLFEVVQKVQEINTLRRYQAPGRQFTGASFVDPEVQANPALQLDYITAVPRMALYIDYSTRIFNVYLRHVAPEDIHSYSIDEVFLDLTAYVGGSLTAARAFVKNLIQEIYRETGITAAGGIGTNLYLSKVAMDIMAKHVEPDENGIRIAELNELEYRRKLWSHRPLTDFWRVGKGYAAKLEAQGLHTMGDVARCSIGQPDAYYNEDLLYRLFGVNAELLIDHAWGHEPCTMADIKAYQPESTSIGTGQVLQSGYSFEKARLVVREMADDLALTLVDKGCLTDQLVLTVGYDIENIKNSKSYQGAVQKDPYGRTIPKHGHGTANLEKATASGQALIKASLELYDRITDPHLLVRRLYLTAGRVLTADAVASRKQTEQLELFIDYEAEAEREAQETARLERETRQQQAILDIKKKFGKNAIIKGLSLEEGATAQERNRQIGGHKA